MKNVKTILITFLIGCFIGSAITFSIFYFKTQNYRRTITRMERESEAIEGQLRDVQTKFNKVKQGLKGIQEKAGELSTEIGDTADSIGDISGGIESVIDGLERSISLIEKLTEFLGYLEEVFTKFGIEAPSG